MRKIDILIKREKARLFLLGNKKLYNVSEIGRCIGITPVRMWKFVSYYQGITKDIDIEKLDNFLTEHYKKY